jgi:hypothetical protein
MTLCPLSFGAATTAFTGPNLRTINYVARRSVAPNPVARTVIEAGGGGNQMLSAIQPTAVIFFHKLFHLVLGNDVTCPTIGEIYNLFRERNKPVKIIGLDYAVAEVNPESYVLAAVAYDYTVNWDRNAAGNAIEFYSGWATQG